MARPARIWGCCSPRAFLATSQLRRPSAWLGTGISSGSSGFSPGALATSRSWQRRRRRSLWMRRVSGNAPSPEARCGRDEVARARFGLPAVRISSDGALTRRCSRRRLRGRHVSAWRVRLEGCIMVVAQLRAAAELRVSVPVSLHLPAHVRGGCSRAPLALVITVRHVWHRGVHGGSSRLVASI